MKCSLNFLESRDETCQPQQMNLALTTSAVDLSPEHLNES